DHATLVRRVEGHVARGALRDDRIAARRAHDAGRSIRRTATRDLRRDLRPRAGAELLELDVDVEAVDAFFLHVRLPERRIQGDFAPRAGARAAVVVPEHVPKAPLSRGLLVDPPRELGDALERVGLVVERGRTAHERERGDRRAPAALARDA